MSVLGFRPYRHYLNLSLTGTYCELLCPLCRGLYLRSMIDASKPSRLQVILEHYYNLGARGFLLSGGFNKDGYLMISREHLRVIREFKKSNEVVFSIHLGLAPRDLLEEVWSAGIDFIDFEVPPNSNYLRILRNLPNHRVEQYLKFIEQAMSLSKSFIVPHLILDSIAAKIDEEINVVHEIALLKPRLMVFLIEIRGGKPNDVKRVLQVLRISRKLFNEISLGCMRSPKFKVYDDLIISEGLVDRIANPRTSTVRRFNIRVLDACCSIERRHFKLFPTLNI